MAYQFHSSILHTHMRIETMFTQKQTHQWTFTASLFIIVKKRKLLKCLSTDEWINKMWRIHKTECCVCVLAAQSGLTLQPYGLWPSRLLCPWDSPGKDTGVGCHSLHQRNFPTQGSNPGLLHHRQVLYCLSYREVLYIHVCVCVCVCVCIYICMYVCVYVCVCMYMHTYICHGYWFFDMYIWNILPDCH